MRADDPPALPVTCGLRKARKLIRRMDDAAFRAQALRFIARYRATCGKSLSAADATALANDEAIVRFHADDDAGCLKALDGAKKQSTATLYNRALCGAPCDMDAAKCSAAAEARRKAVAGRPFRQALLERTKAFCWDCKHGKPCEVPPPEQRPIWGTHWFSWDLKRSVYPPPKGLVSVDSRIAWAGDLNGDGIGDLVFLGHTVAPDMSSAALNGYASDPTETWDIAVSLGCGSPERYRGIWGEDMLDQDDYAVESETTGKSSIWRVCVHPDATPDKKQLASPPRKCIDFPDWRKVEQALQSNGVGGRGNDHE
jgi:hypothetical protein